MTRQIHVGTTIAPDHPLIELLDGIGPARMLLRALGDATLRGLAHTDPDLAEATRGLVDIVRRETGDELDVASKLPIGPESNALVLRLRARLGALETVERALRAVPAPDPGGTLPARATLGPVYPGTPDDERGPA